MFCPLSIQESSVGSFTLPPPYREFVVAGFDMRTV
jgi:hypothetical protein